MYIFLDESYNLKNRTKPQFISINGFALLDAKSLFKRWKKCRSPFTGKRRIHATDSVFDKLRLKALKLIGRPDLTLLSAFQIIQQLPLGKDKNYFKKNKLNFDKIYFDLLVALFAKLSLKEYKNIKILIDSRKHKGGLLAKRMFRKEVVNFLKKKCPGTKVEFKMQPASTNILLELADFISNIFYRAYVKNDNKFFEDLQFKMIQTKNPLK